MPVHRDPAAAAGLAEHHGEALAVARRKYPGLSPDDHHDIVQEAFARVLARLQHGPLVDPRSYLLRVVYTSGAYVLRDRHRQVLSLDQHGEDQDGVELQLDRSAVPPSAEERVLAVGELASLARIARSELSPEELRALLLRSVDGQTPVEVAQAMQISVRRYRKLLERGGRRLSAGVSRERDDEALLAHALGCASRAERERAETLLERFEGRAALAALRARLNLPVDSELEAVA